MNELKESFQRWKFNNMMRHIRGHLKDPIRAYGYKYIIQLLAKHKKNIKRNYTNVELLQFNCIKESISKKIIDDLKAKSFINDDMIELICVLLSPETQDTIFISPNIINKYEPTGLVYFFNRQYWKEIVEEKIMTDDMVYLGNINNILKSTIIISDKRGNKNKNNTAICCPFYITVFVIRVIMLENLNIKDYYNNLITNIFVDNKIIKMLMLYIAFTISHEVRAIKVDDEIKDLHTKNNYMELRDYILNYDWDNLKFLYEHISLDSNFKNRLVSIIREFSEAIDTYCEDAELLEYQLISGEEPDNAQYWVEKKKYIENLFNEVFVDAYRKI